MDKVTALIKLFIYHLENIKILHPPADVQLHSILKSIQDSVM